MTDSKLTTTPALPVIRDDLVRTSDAVVVPKDSVTALETPGSLRDLDSAALVDTAKEHRELLQELVTELKDINRRSGKSLGNSLQTEIKNIVGNTYLKLEQSTNIELLHSLIEAASFGNHTQVNEQNMAKMQEGARTLLSLYNYKHDAQPFYPLLKVIFTKLRLLEETAPKLPPPEDPRSPGGAAVAKEMALELSLTRSTSGSGTDRGTPLIKVSNPLPDWIGNIDANNAKEFLSSQECLPYANEIKEDLLVLAKKFERSPTRGGIAKLCTFINQLVTGKGSHVKDDELPTLIGHLYNGMIAARTDGDKIVLGANSKSAWLLDKLLLKAGSTEAAKDLPCEIGSCYFDYASKQLTDVERFRQEVNSMVGGSQGYEALTALINAAESLHPFENTVTINRDTLLEGYRQLADLYRLKTNGGKENLEQYQLVREFGVTIGVLNP